MTGTNKVLIIMSVILQLVTTGLYVSTCRVVSDRLTHYVSKRIERLLDPTTLSLSYWEDEPLDAKGLAIATGLNITLAETKFDSGGPNQINPKDGHFIQDLFISCSADKARQNVLAVNLELDNPFKIIKIRFLPDASSTPLTFYLHLQQSSFVVQLNQQIGYEDCIHINYVQLTSNVEYVIECDECNEIHQSDLGRMFKKRISHLDAELCTLLSDKLMLGLRNSLDQEKLELELNV